MKKFSVLGSVRTEMVILSQYSQPSLAQNRFQDFPNNNTSLKAFIYAVLTLRDIRIWSNLSWNVTFKLLI